MRTPTLLANKIILMIKGDLSVLKESSLHFYDCVVTHSKYIFESALSNGSNQVLKYI